MKTFFTLFDTRKDIKKHPVKVIDNVQAIDVFEGDYIIRVRTSGVSVIKNGKIELDHVIHSIKEKMKC